MGAWQDIFGGKGEEHEQKIWRGMSVDAELKDEWLERLNAIPEIAIRGTDIGGLGAWHQGPSVVFHTNFLEGGREAPEETLKAFVSGVESYFSDLASVEADWDGYVVFFQVWSPIHRREMGEEGFNEWWEQVITRMESLPMAIRGE